MALSTWLDGRIGYQNLIDMDINQVIENNASDQLPDQIENNDIDYFEIYIKVI